MPKPERLTHCPETGRSLEGIDPRKHAANLWPELHKDTHKFTTTEAYKRYSALIAEADARDEEAQDARAAERTTTKPRKEKD